MLTYLPSERITIEEVLQHPWLNKQYSDLDDPSAPWICRYDGGYKYFAASLWYRESILGEVLTESKAMYFGGREEKLRNARKEEPAQDEEDTFYDCVEGIYCDAVEYQDLDCSTPEAEEPGHEDELDDSRERQEDECHRSCFDTCVDILILCVPNQVCPQRHRSSSSALLHEAQSHVTVMAPQRVASPQIYSSSRKESRDFSRLAHCVQ